MNGHEFVNDSLIEGWATHFESLSVPPSTSLSAAQQEVYDTYINIQALPSDTPDLVTVDEVAAIIHALPRRKAAGPDRLANEHLRFSSSVLSTLLSTIFIMPFSFHASSPCHSEWATSFPSLKVMTRT